MATAVFLSNALQGARDVDAIGFDAITNFSVNQTAKVTNNPVQDGSNIADHQVLNPRTISFNGVITPWNFTGKGSDLTPLELVRRIESTMVNKVYFDLFLSDDLDSISNCMITNFDYNREAKEGGALLVSLEAQQIDLVPKAGETDITNLALSPDVSEQGQEAQNGGDGVTKTAFVERFDFLKDFAPSESDFVIEE